MDGQVYRTIGTSSIQYVPIKLLPDSLKDIIILVEYNNDENLNKYLISCKVEDINIHDGKTALFIMNDNHKLIRTPRIIPLSRYYRIDRGS